MPGRAIPGRHASVGKQTVTEQQVVSGEARKERIQLDVTDQPGPEK